jgi:hypothetical protein
MEEDYPSPDLYPVTAFPLLASKVTHLQVDMFPHMAAFLLLFDNLERLELLSSGQVFLRRSELSVSIRQALSSLKNLRELVLNEANRFQPIIVGTPTVELPSVTKLKITTMDLRRDTWNFVRLCLPNLETMTIHTWQEYHPEMRELADIPTLSSLSQLRRLDIRAGIRTFTHILKSLSTTRLASIEWRNSDSEYDSGEPELSELMKALGPLHDFLRHMFIEAGAHWKEQLQTLVTQLGHVAPRIVVTSEARDLVSPINVAELCTYITSLVDSKTALGDSEAVKDIVKAMAGLEQYRQLEEL